MIGAAKHTDTGIIDTLYWAFDSMNRTGGTLSSDLPPGNQNNIAIATTLSDRYFIKQTDTQGNYIFAPVSKDGDYFEILWNGAGSFNHSWGLAAINGCRRDLQRYLCRISLRERQKSSECNASAIFFTVLLTAVCMLH
jgi:hypothetical protein